MQPAFPVQNIYRISSSDMEMPGGLEAGAQGLAGSERGIALLAPDRELAQAHVDGGSTARPLQNGRK